nr:hypothetical protein [Escherichia coli]
MFHTIVSIKNDGHYFCRAGGNRPDGLNEPVTVKTIKRDYISIMPKPDGLTAAKNLAEAFEHYNEW